MIVLLLVVIWLVVLTPVIAHRLSSANLFASVARYRASTRLVGKILGHSEDVIPVSTMKRPPAGLSHRETALRSAERERIRNDRRRMVLRRRRTVAVLLASLLGSLLLGSVPRLHALWDLTVLDAVGLFAYLAVLAHVTRLEVNAAERRRKVIVLPRTILPVLVDQATDLAPGM